MGFTKPDRVVRFGGTAGAPAANFAEPAAGKKDVGWVLDDEPPGSFWNWLTYKSYQWFRWFNERMFDGVSAADFTIRAPTPAATSDVGGDLILEGGIAGTDADKAGGDATLSGGDATGDQASTVIVKAATAGAAGVGARAAENYLTADGSVGDVGRVSTVKPFVGTSPAGSAEPGVAAIAVGTGYGLSGIADTNSPVRASLHLGPQDADPSSPANGDVYPNSATDQFNHYSAVLGRFQAMDSIVEATKADSATVTEPDALTAFSQTYTVPANTLRAGSVIKIMAWGAFNRVAAVSFELQILYGTYHFGVPRTAPGAPGQWMIEGTAIFRTIGGAGTFEGRQHMETTEGSPPTNPLFSMSDTTRAGVDTTVNNDISIKVKMGTGGATDTAFMKGFIVDIQ